MTTSDFLLAIFMECGCEVIAPSTEDPQGVILAPHACIDHGGYYLGECPPGITYQIIKASGDEVRQMWKETLEEPSSILPPGLGHGGLMEKWDE